MAGCPTFAAAVTAKVGSSAFPIGGLFAKCAVTSALSRLQPESSKIVC